MSEMKKTLREMQVGSWFRGESSALMCVDMAQASVWYSSLTWLEIFCGQISFTTMMIELCLQKLSAEILAPRPSECGLIGHRVTPDVTG